MEQQHFYDLRDHANVGDRVLLRHSARACYTGGDVAGGTCTVPAGSTITITGFVTLSTMGYRSIFLYDDPDGIHLASWAIDLSGAVLDNNS